MALHGVHLDVTAEEGPKQTTRQGKRLALAHKRTKRQNQKPESQEKMAVEYHAGPAPAPTASAACECRCRFEPACALIASIIRF